MPKRKRQKTTKEVVQIELPTPNFQTSNDVYETLFESFTLSLNPPQHWLKEIPSYNQKDDGEENMARPVIVSTRDRIQELNQIKSNLMPYSQIVSEAKIARSIHTTPENEFRRASRSKRVNPFESLLGSIEFKTGEPLICRSALKLCNMDALTNFKLTQDKECGIFVDLAGSPGGFSQYLIHRGLKRGFGFSLKGNSTDSAGLAWKTDGILTKEQFVIHNGSDGTGDIYNWDNIISLRDTIQKDISIKKDERIALVVADGGIDAQRNHEDQEGISSKLIISEIAAALLLLSLNKADHKDASFVLKLFGFQSTAIRRALFFLTSVFDTIQIMKPITSRPASCERYLLAIGFKGIKKGMNLANWREEIIHGGNCFEYEEKTAFQSFVNFLDKVDNDMACLNIRACHGIVETLRKEEIQIKERTTQRKNRNGFSDTLNVDYMKTSWQL